MAIFLPHARLASPASRALAEDRFLHGLGAGFGLRSFMRLRPMQQSMK
jgi:hypothetical protein